jgi:hypothetical protein
MGRASLPIVVWFAHFALIYGFTGLACARHMSAVVPWVVGVASAAALLALIAVAVPAGMRAAQTAQLQYFLTLGLAGLAIVAIAWETSSLLWIAACA